MLPQKKNEAYSIFGSLSNRIQRLLIQSCILDSCEFF